MAHTIGNGSAYDVDMEIIESFIRAKKEPNNPIAQIAVFTYYISQLYNYWNHFKENINTYSGRGKGDYFWSIDENLDKAIDLYNEVKTPKVKSAQAEYNKSFIIKNLQRYEERLLYLIGEAQDTFQTTKILDINIIFNLYKYVGSLMCLEPNAESISLSLPRNSFLLTNETGLFGFNTYLYAYVSGINLIGIPRHDQYFDEYHSCALGFLGHDIDHTRRIASKYTTHVAGIYYKIMDLDIPKGIKELLIFVLWVRLHEFEVDDFMHIDHKNYENSIYRINSTTTNIMENLNDELERLSDFIEDEDGFAIINKVFNTSSYDYGGIKEEDKFLLVMMYGYAYIIENIIPLI